VTGLDARLQALVRSSDWLMGVLRAVRDVDPPDWLAGVPWDAKNQAAVHRWYGRVFGAEVPPLASAADGVATWPETATAVAVRLDDGDELRVVAPCGLEDLFALVCRRNPRRVSVDQYRRRLREKRVAERWPKVTIVDP
jgi:hypothetical protein